MYTMSKYIRKKPFIPPPISPDIEGSPNRQLQLKNVKTHMKDQNNPKRDLRPVNTAESSTTKPNTTKSRMTNSKVFTPRQIDSSSFRVEMRVPTDKDLNNLETADESKEDLERWTHFNDERAENPNHHKENPLYAINVQEVDRRFTKNNKTDVNAYSTNDFDYNVTRGKQKGRMKVMKNTPIDFNSVTPRKYTNVMNKSPLQDSIIWKDTVLYTLNPHFD